MKLPKFFFALLGLIISQSGFAQNFKPVQDLIGRRFSAMKGKVTFSKINFVGHDSATYVCANGKLSISANNVNAASYALYDYVKKYTHSSLSHTGDNIDISSTLPNTKTIGRIAAVYPLRYALNYCTFNYTMAFWKWDDWERELDWMSLNGVNLMLAQIGTEEVWQKTLAELGFNDKEIKDFIPGPGFNAWWLMGNLQGWGGPVSDNMIHHWTSLQKKMLARMKELGIEPVVQGFTGLVPSTLKNHFPDARIVDQGDWWGFTRPVVLLPTDPLFDRIASLYYKNIKNLYGSDIHYLGGDLFHEGGRTQGVDLKQTANLVQKNMQEHLPQSTWVLQGWQSNPRPEILAGLNPKNTLIIDLLGDDNETWLKRNQYGGFPWIWSTVTNYGGKTTSSGPLLRSYTETKKAEDIFGKDLLLKGTGIIPEGIENNAIVYQWALDRSWLKNTPDFQTKLDEFITIRYGILNTDLKQAWQYLFQTLYSGYNPLVTGGQGGFESIFCGRPAVKMGTTSCCGPSNLWYDIDVLTQAALSLTKASKSIKQSEAFRFDLTDIWRQIINLRGRQAYDRLNYAIEKKNKPLFEKNRDEFVKLLLLQDKWLATNKMFRLGRWLTQAKAMLPDAADQKLCEWNARVQITFWGTIDNPNNLLHDYANKEWQGLLKDLYLPRWNAFFDYMEAKIDGKDVSVPKYFDMEKAWCSQQNNYSEQPEGDVGALIQEIIQTVATNKPTVS